MSIGLSRRSFVAGAVAAMSMGASLSAIAAPAERRRFLLLIELIGGNDGLNTIVPYGDESYARIRGDLAIPAADVIPLEGGVLGFHPSLLPLRDIYKVGRLAVLQSVGHPWMRSGKDFGHLQAQHQSSLVADVPHGGGGWAARMGALQANRFDWRVAAAGLSFNCLDEGPLEGFGGLVSHHPNISGDHEVRVLQDLSSAPKEVMVGLGAQALRFPSTPFGQSMARCADLVLRMHSGASGYIPVLRVGIGSFDTHADQLQAHAKLLSEMALGIRAFYDVLSQNSMVDRVLMMTYSEFGRSVIPNSRGGTDHGFSADHILIGDGIYGGYHGNRLRLGGDPSTFSAYSLDFRSICAGILMEHFMVDSIPVLGPVRRHGIYKFSDRVPTNFA